MLSMNVKELWQTLLCDQLRTSLLTQQRTLRLALAAVVLWPCLASGDWLQFRGPNGQGHSDAKDLPVTWSEKKNVAWKVTIPGTGYSSPVVTGDKIWLTTALEKGRSLRAICVDRKSGDLAYNIEVFRPGEPGPRHGKNSFATPTPVVSGEHVFVDFGPKGTACLSKTGKIVWQTQALNYQQPYSGASSPIVVGDLLILNCDGTHNQFVTALDTRTGKEVWKTPRTHVKVEHQNTNEAMSYSTPAVFDVDGIKQIVSSAADHVAAYDARSGEELWWLGYDGFSEVAVPLSGHGLVFVVGFENTSESTLFAIRPQARGKINDTQLAWKRTKRVPHVPSPLLVGDDLYLFLDNGIVACVDAKSGQEHWRDRLPGNYSASPIFADGKIYISSEEGETSVLAPGRTLKALGQNTLDGHLLASPAASGNSLYVRSDRHLYRIEK